jgi:hypothetical protein
MATQESTSSGRDIIRDNYEADMVHTFPTRKQSMELYEKVDELQAFRDWRLEYGFIPAICDGLEMSRKQCLRPGIHGNLDLFLQDDVEILRSSLENKIPEGPATMQ